MRRVFSAIVLSLFAQQSSGITAAAVGSEPVVRRPIAAPPRTQATPQVQRTPLATPTSTTVGPAVDAKTLFARAPLGVTARAVLASLGYPHYVAHQAGSDYLAYKVSNGDGFFVVRLANEVVDAVQVTNISHNTASFRDEYGVQLGDDARRVSSAVIMLRPISETLQSTIRAARAPNFSAVRAAVPTPAPYGANATWKYVAAAGSQRFYVLDGAGKVDRFGLTRSSKELPVGLRGKVAV